MHHRVTPRAQLAALPHGHDGAGLGVHDLHLQVRLHLAHGGHALFQRRFVVALAAHRAGLGHAVGDGDLAQVHVLDHALHHLDRARRARHDAGAQRGQIELGKARMIELGNEHGRHAVQARALLGLHRLKHLEGIKAVAGINDGGAVRDAGQIAQHHAEAVVQGHGNAQPVFGREPHALTDEEAVVQNVAVRERGALGETGGATGELDVDRVGVLERGGDGVNARIARIATREQVGKAQHARLLVTLARLVDPHHRFQRRQACCRELAGLGRGQLGRQLAQHAQVVAGLEAGHADQRLAVHLVDGVFHLGSAVGGIDVHQHQANLRRGELHQHPFGIVVRPDADAVALFKPQAQQRAGQLAGGAVQLCVGEALILVGTDQRVAIRLARRHVAEEISQRLLDQRLAGCTRSLAQNQAALRLLGIHGGMSPGFMRQAAPPAAGFLN
ncbi:hypothetical protein SDC9_104853 [bioreactor metagenome]|uniref:Uncharacterized protein n=1 Tax=bioreactor metagenome TaxID=1076179 RepID=A0A645B8K6_9ZZZZ